MRAKAKEASLRTLSSLSVPNFRAKVGQETENVRLLEQECQTPRVFPSPLIEDQKQTRADWDSVTELRRVAFPRPTFSSFDLCC